jgi:hypothetical protein
MTETLNSNDPLIDEVREVRLRISQEFGNDPRRLVEHYMELQKKYADRLIYAAKRHVESVAKSGREED